MVKKAKELSDEYTPHSIAFYTSGALLPLPYLCADRAHAARALAGQLYLEEYHTLALLGKAGFGCVSPLFLGILASAADPVAQHPAHGRQHPSLHGDRGGGHARELRLRRTTRLVHRLCAFLQSSSEPTGPDHAIFRTTATRSSWSGTTWRPRRPSSGVASWTALPAQTLYAALYFSQRYYKLTDYATALPYCHGPTLHLGRTRRARARRHSPSRSRRHQPVPPQRHPQDPSRQRGVPRQRLDRCALASPSWLSVTPR